MENPLSIIGKTLRYFWEELFNLMLCNLIWLCAQLLIIPGPPATAALFYVTNRVAHGSLAKVPEFWDGFKRYFVVGWKWGALNLAAIIVFGYAALFYGSGTFPEPWGYLLMLLNMALLLGWLFLQLFAFPFWLEQYDRRIRLALRNALATLAQNLRLTLLAVILTAVVVGLTIALPALVALASVAFLFLLGNVIVVAQVEALQNKEGQPSE